ncbi:MAG: metallopeptidase family protein, partial [Gammaproteobacteria bacterium]|nr:metallopeptidase family protein [Gammaproteobacteria bacterium]
ELGLPPDELRVEVERTLIHEIAHYFGIDDDHLDEIGWG